MAAGPAIGGQTRDFDAKGVVKELNSDGRTIVIRHEAITNYMEAMTMPFRVRQANELTDLHAGDQITFRLHVTETESWIDQISRLGASTPAQPAGAELPSRPEPQPEKKKHPLWSARFTNELGQPVTLADYKGQALAITFFFTKCPIPEFCPRLSKNFQEASASLARMPNAPTNWHFLSVSFDPQYDTPAVLKNYAESYGYDPVHWSFLTGPSNQVAQLARDSGLKFEREGPFFNHDFRTLIVDTAGHLQMIFPVSGNLSDSIVQELLKAATNSAWTQPPARLSRAKK